MIEEKVIEILETEYLYYKEAEENQLKSNERIDKIIIWIIGFVFIFLGLIFNNLDEICLTIFSKLALMLSILSTVSFALLSRVYSYYFSLSYSANINYLKRKIMDQKQKNRDTVLSNYENEIPLLAIKAKNSTIKNIKMYKNKFVRFSYLTLFSFLIFTIITLLIIFL